MVNKLIVLFIYILPISSLFVRFMSEYVDVVYLTYRMFYKIT